MKELSFSNFKLGIIAGGQLGKMICYPASIWGIDTYILDKSPECPAASVCHKLVIGDPTDFDSVYQFGLMVDLLTYEVENINIEALKQLKKEGISINPDPDSLEIIQNKELQKLFYTKNKIPTAPFSSYSSAEEIINSVKNNRLKFPFVQKLCKGGYDGKGVRVINSESDLKKLFASPSIVEEAIHIKKEISIIVARNNNGEVKCFPPVEMIFNAEANLVDLVVCPASLNKREESLVMQYANRIISTLGINGLLAIEMFLDKENKIWINEMAPRPHNSGHHTIESVITSQFEQLLRAILGLPLGSTMLISPSVMINLIGEPNAEGMVKFEGFKECLNIEGAKIHLYGKKNVKPYRKMGHITLIGNSRSALIKKSSIVKQLIKVKSW